MTLSRRIGSIIHATLDFGIVSESRGVVFGITTLWLALFHSTGIRFSDIRWLPLWLTEPMDRIRVSGNIGVDIFLIMSAIGLYYSMEKDADVIHFYKRRIKRLFPEVIICTVLWFGLMECDLSFYLSHIFLRGGYLSRGKHTFGISHC